MADKIKVYNPQKFDVGIITQDKPMGINVKSGSFVLLTQDEISYLASVCTLFQRGCLRVEEKHAAETMQELGIDVNNDPNYVDDEDIKAKLSGTPKSIEKWLAGITEPYVFDRIYDVAADMNLSVAKVKVLQAKMPNKNFLED